MERRVWRAGGGQPQRNNTAVGDANTANHDIRVGYACISIPLRAQRIFCSRTVRLGTVVKEDCVDLDMLRRLSSENVEDLAKILEYNDSWGCRFFRITSNLFPHMGNPKLPADYNFDFLRPRLAQIGKYARDHRMRITMHPGQFAQLGAPNDAIVQQTYVDLAVQGKTLIAMGMRPVEDGACMVIHGGGVYDDKDATMRRFANAYANMDPEIAQYIVLENDEFSYSVYDLLPFCEKHSIPFVVDFFHHAVWCRRNDVPFDGIWQLMDRIVGTWRARGIKPKCHYSEQKEGTRDGAHSDSVVEIPSEILRYAVMHGIDIMLEVKDKDVCTRAVLERQFRQIERDGLIHWVPKTADRS